MHHVIPTSELVKEIVVESNLVQHRIMTNLWGGVFAVHLLSEPGTTDKVKFQPVERLLGPDPLGQLFIGWSDDFLAIAAEMGGTAKPQKRGVAPFTSAYDANSAVKEAIPWDHLAVSFLFREGPFSAGAEYLTRYQMRFGEYPPMNDFQLRWPP